MDVRVHGKNMQVSDELREMAVARVIHAHRILEDGVGADVEFSEETNPRVSGGRFGVEITSVTAGHVVRIEASAADDRSALDLATVRYENQLRRLKERLIQRSRPVGGNKRLNPDGATSEEDGDRPIVRTKRFAMKPMTPEEATLQMEMLGHDFFFFLDAASGKHCVLYHRRDGSLGLIEPE